MTDSSLLSKVQTALASHDYEAAEDAYRKYLSEPKHLKDSKVWHELGELLTTAQQYYDAVDAYSSAVEFEPENAKYLSALGESLATIHEYDEAKLWFQKAAEFSDNIRCQFKVGDMMGFLGQYDEALVFYTLLSSRYPDEPDLLRRKAVVYHHLGREADAMRTLTKEIELRKTIIGKEHTAESHFQLGKTYTRAGLWYEAEGEFQTATKLEPKNPDYHRRLGAAFIKNKNEPAGLTEFSKAAELSGNNFLFLIKIAEMLTKLKQYDESIKYFTQALGIHNINADAWAGIAYSLLQLEKFEEAKAFWEMAKATDYMKGIAWIDRVHKSYKTDALDAAFEC